MPAIILTGFSIREALRRWELKRDAASSLFDGSLKKFFGEEKMHPLALMKNFQQADAIIAKLQVAQDMYNLAVTVEVQGQMITLAEAVKLIGAAGRREKMWRTAAVPKKERYQMSTDEVRKDDETRPVQVMKIEEMLSEADTAARYAAALRFATAQGNVQERTIEIPGLELSMLA
jgi:hypothetical protein